MDDFDVVVIIRGGGATSDLSGFDTLKLAENVANFPLPVITGIGHERDESIIDMISNTSVITPTAAAAMLIDNLATVYNGILSAQDIIVNTVKKRMELERMRISRLADLIPTLFFVVKTRLQSRLDRLYGRLSATMSQQLSDELHHIDILSQKIRPVLERKLLDERHRMQLMAQRMDTVNPERMLRRGYSITLHYGKSVRDPKLLKQGDKIETIVEKGSVISIIK